MRLGSLLFLGSSLLFLGACATGPEGTPPRFGGAGTASHEEATRWTEETLAGLSLAEKAAQMICVPMRGDMTAQSPEFAKLAALVRDQGIGALVLYGGAPVPTARLLNRLQELARLPLLVSADFEGGPGQQFAGATEFPANMALAAIGSEEIAYRAGQVGAREGRAIGVHLTYSPVVDIQSDPQNPVLGVRSFGSDLDLLGRLAGAYIRGYQENGMLATAKHYPGRGDVERIAGTKFTINPKPAARVEGEDLSAFQRAIDAGVVYIMTEHIAVPAVTGGSNLPASVEGKLVQGWLRERLGFAGIITTDDMWYEKVTKRFGPVRACVLAIQAGHDAILKPADAAKTIRGLVAAVEQGEIGRQQIDRSVGRILYWKARLGLHQKRLVDLASIPARVGTTEHLALLRQIADSSLTLLVNQGFLPRPAAKLGRIVHLTIQRRSKDRAPQVVAAKLAKAFPETRHFAFGAGTGTDPFQEALAAIQEAETETVIVSLFNPRKVYVDNGPLAGKHRRLLEEVFRRKPRGTVVVSYGNPYAVAGLQGAAAILVGYGEGGFYGNQTIYADSLIRLLRGELVPRGRLPVAVPPDFPRGSGLR